MMKIDFARNIALKSLYEINIKQAYSNIVLDKFINENREKFYKFLRDNSLENTINKFIPISLKDLIVEKSKHILYKTGMLQVIKKVRSKIKK